MTFKCIQTIEKELILRISGVCQPISKIFGDPLPVWGNPNLIINKCSWCISSRVDCNYEHSDRDASPEWLHHPQMLKHATFQEQIACT